MGGRGRYQQEIAMRSLIIVLALGACGIKGDPEPVAQDPKREPGISISGNVGIGVTTTIRN